MSQFQHCLRHYFSSLASSPSVLRSSNLDQEAEMELLQEKIHAKFSDTQIRLVDAQQQKLGGGQEENEDNVQTYMV